MPVLNCMTRTTLDGVVSSLRFILARLRPGQMPRTRTAPEEAAVDPWVSAIDAVADMNEHTLRDIGAPAWLMAEVRHRQGLASKRLLELHIR